MVANQRVEAVLAKDVDVSDEFGADREVSGAVEKSFGGGAEAGVALVDFLDRIVGESVQNR